MERSTGTARSSRVPAIVVTLIIVGLFGGLTYGTDAVTRQVHEQVQANAAVGVTFVEDTVGAIVGMARAFSDDDDFVDAVGDGSVNGVDTDRLGAIFGPANRRNPGISAMAVITLDGRMAAISPSSAALVGVDFSYRDWFNGVVAADDVYVSEAYITAAAGHPRVVGIAAPIRSPTDVTIAYLLITYQVDAIEAFIDRFASRDILFTVTDQRGVVVGAPGPASERLVSLRGDPGVDAALAGRSQQGDSVVGGEHWVSAHAPVPGFGWTVRADVVASTAYTGVTNLRRTVLALAGVVVLGLGGSLIAVAHSGRRRRQAEARSSDAAHIIEEDRNQLRISLAEKHAAEIRYRTLTDHLPDTAVMVWDTDLRLETVAGPGAKLWRYAERNVIPGRLLEEIVDANEAALLRPFYESGLSTPGTLEYHSEPTGLDFRFDVAPIPRADGTPERVLVMVRDVTERRRLNLRLQHLADHDPLTGLRNRRSFEAELERHVDNVDRYGVCGALLILDLDHFKQINDTLGHSVGDELIVSLGDTLRRRLRATDVIARLGGDEFAVILPRVNRAQAELVAQNLIDAVRIELIVPTQSQVRRPTISIGVAMFDTPGVGAKEMFIRADLAMYAAKAAGRDGFQMHPRPTIGAVSPSPRPAGERHTEPAAQAQSA